MTSGPSGALPVLGTTSATTSDAPAGVAAAPPGRRPGAVDRAREPRRADPLTGAIPVIDPDAGTGPVARLRRKLMRLVRRWQRSLGLRVSMMTMAGLTVAFAALSLLVSWQIREGFYTERVDEVLTDAAFRTARAQESFNASTATTSQEIQRLATGAVEQQVIGITSGPVGAMLMRSPGQPPSPFSEPTTSIALRGLVTSEMRQAVDGGQQYWQSVALPVSGGRTAPGVVVGQSVTLPGQDRYQYYLVYSLQTEESTIRVVLQVLGFAAAAFILVLGVIIWLVVRSVLRPVRQAALSAERLADGLLDERMEVRGRDEIARLARSFNEMAASLQHQIERLASLSALQQRFVSDVSHELRTPLTTVKMAADLIYEGREDFPPQLRRSAELLQTQIDRFDAMLADLLEISRIDAGAAVLDLERQDLREIVRRVVEMTQILAERKDSALTVVAPDEPCVAECDGRRIERVIRNLVVNAIEHSEGRGVVVTVAASDDAVGVRVRDHGVGMTAQEAGRVFDRFWRADPARARTTGGTGLGLTISLEDARLHGGTVEASGSPGRGASFLLVLPHTAGAAVLERPIELDDFAAEEAAEAQAAAEAEAAARALEAAQADEAQAAAEAREAAEAADVAAAEETQAAPDDSDVDPGAQDDGGAGDVAGDAAGAGGDGGDGGAVSSREPGALVGAEPVAPPGPAAEDEIDDLDVSYEEEFGDYEDDLDVSYEDEFDVLDDVAPVVPGSPASSPPTPPATGPQGSSEYPPSGEIPVVDADLGFPTHPPRSRPYLDGGETA